jgi:hypothetical protein
MIGIANETSITIPTTVEINGQHFTPTIIQTYTNDLQTQTEPKTNKSAEITNVQNITDNNTTSTYNSSTKNNNNIVNYITIQPTTILFSTSRPPSRNTPVYNPEKGDCHRNKTESSMRFLTQNMNGLQPHTLSKFEGTLDRLKYLMVNVVALQETCVNWGHSDTTQRFKNTIYKRTPGAHLSISPIPTNYTNPYLPGGTLTLTVGKWRSFIEKSIVDPDNMGRWTGTSFEFTTNVVYIHLVRIVYAIVEHKRILLYQRIINSTSHYRSKDINIRIHANNLSKI